MNNMNDFNNDGYIEEENIENNTEDNEQNSELEKIDLY